VSGGLNARRPLFGRDDASRIQERECQTAQGACFFEHPSVCCHKEQVEIAPRSHTTEVHRSRHGISGVRLEFRVRYPLSEAIDADVSSHGSNSWLALVEAYGERNAAELVQGLRFKCLVDIAIARPSKVAACVICTWLIESQWRTRAVILGCIRARADPSDRPSNTINDFRMALQTTLQRSWRKVVVQATRRAHVQTTVQTTPSVGVRVA